MLSLTSKTRPDSHGLGGNIVNVVLFGHGKQLQRHRSKLYMNIRKQPGEVLQ